MSRPADHLTPTPCANFQRKIRRTESLFTDRMAMGASRVDVLRLVLLQGLWLTSTGVALGLAFALGVTRIIARLLYGIGANDPITVVSVVMLLGAMSLAACYLPAHRAMRRNPVTAIREL